MPRASRRFEAPRSLFRAADRNVWVAPAQGMRAGRSKRDPEIKDLLIAHVVRGSRMETTTQTNLKTVP
jgi:hypothetical protein